MAKRVLFVTAVWVLLLSACAPAAAPTVDPVQVQASAMAAAGTMVAQTREAAPTPTAVPPTPLPSSTPLPTPTLLALPSLSAELSPTVAAAGSSDPCKQAMTGSPQGPLTTFKIVNANKAPITVSLGLTAMTKFGECGYRSYALGPMDSIWTESNFPQGCYWAFAFVNDPKKPSQASSSQAGCANNDDKWTWVVHAEVINFYSP